MILLLGGSPGGYPTLDPEFTGWIVTPRKWGTGHLADPAFRWAADNDCFSQGDSFNFENYYTYLSRLSPYQDRCLFVTVPDVVGDAVATHRFYLEYAPPLRDQGWKLAFVAQDGLDRLPSVDYDCLFIGGTDGFKLSPLTGRLIREAVNRGKWVHFGRVNSYKRLNHAYKLGCHSVDGNHWTFEPSDIRRTIPFLRSQRGQGRLLLGEDG